MNSSFAVIMSAMAGYSAIGQAAVKRTAEGPKGAQRAAKEARIADTSCKEICQKAPIPKALAKALDTIVQTAATKGVALDLTEIKIASGGKLEARFDAKIVEKVAAGAQDTVKKDKQKIVKEITSEDSHWAFQKGKGIRLLSKMSFDPLKDSKSIPSKFLERSQIKISATSKGNLGSSYKKIEKRVIGWYARQTGVKVSEFAKKAEQAASFIETRNPEAAKVMRGWLKLRIKPTTFVSPGKIAAAESALRSLSGDALAVATAIDDGKVTWSDLNDYHTEIKRFDRWFNVAEGFTKDSERTEFSEVAKDVSENLKMLSKRALSLASLSKKQSDFPHYVMKGIKHISTRAGINENATKKGAHRTAAFIRYLDADKAVVYQLSGERIVVLDVGLERYASGLLIHEWVHRFNRISGTKIVGTNEIGEKVTSSHVSRILLDVSKNERLNFRAAFLNPSSWFSYIEKEDENVALRADIEELINSRFESLNKDDQNKYIKYTREPRLFGRQ